MMGWQWHQPDHMQIICTTLQTDNHASTITQFFMGPGALPDAQPSVKALKAAYYENKIQIRKYMEKARTVLVLKIFSK